MRLGVLVFTACVLISAVPAKAAERGVIIINPDGTVTESDAPKATYQAAPEAQVTQPEERPEAAPVRKKPVAVKPQKTKNPPAALKATQKLKAVPEQDPEAAHAAAKAKTLEHEQESVFTNDPDDAPVAAPPKAKSAPAKIVKPKKAPASKAAAPATASSPKIKWNKAPKVSKKQMKAEVAPALSPVFESVPQQTGPISREDALRAAIKVAPPFKRSTVLPGNYKGQPVYEVILQTEDGEQSILIDAMTGDVIRAK